MAQPPLNHESSAFLMPQSLSVIVVINEDTDPVPPFVHALSIATACEGELEIVDLRGSKLTRPEIGVRKTFEQWRRLPAGSKREDVSKLGLKVKRVRKHGSSRKEIAKRLDRSRPDLLVIGTQPRKGFAQLFNQGLAEYLATTFRQTTLYLPAGSRPFVSPDTGMVTLNRILVPIAEEPAPESSIQLLQRILRTFPECTPTVRGVHIGDSFPFVSASVLEGLSWSETPLAMDGRSVAQAISAEAARIDAELIVMTTNGRDTLSQKMIGSTTEQVLRAVTCPVLAVAVA